MLGQGVWTLSWKEERVEDGREGHDKARSLCHCFAAVRGERERLGIQAGGWAAGALGEKARRGLSWSRGSWLGPQRTINWLVNKHLCNIPEEWVLNTVSILLLSVTDFRENTPFPSFSQ